VVSFKKFSDEEQSTYLRVSHKTEAIASNTTQSTGVNIPFISTI